MRAPSVAASRTTMRSISSSPCGGIVVEQHELLRTRLAGDVHRVVDGAVAPVPLRLVLLAACAARRGSAGRRRRTARARRAARSRRGRRGSSPGPVVGEVRDRDAVPLDAEAERRADVAHPARPHLREADREVVVADVVEAHVAASSSGGSGRTAGASSRANTSPSGPSAWRGPYTSSVAPGWCSGAKNGRPCTWSQWRCVSSTVPWNSPPRS